MKPSNFAALLFALVFIPLGLCKNIDFPMREMTLPEAMDELKRLSGDDSKFKTTTYSLPRIYHNQGAKVPIGPYKNMPEEQFRHDVIQALCRAHRLVFGEYENSHHRFIRDSAYKVAEPFTLSDALARLQKHLGKSGLDLKDWEIALAELKFESEPGYAGRYWHFQYIRNPATDGGVGTHHFFVWDDLLVEHVPDGNGRQIPNASTMEILKTARTPAF